MAAKKRQANVIKLAWGRLIDAFVAKRPCPPDQFPQWATELIGSDSISEALTSIFDGKISDLPQKKLAQALGLSDRGAVLLYLGPLVGNHRARKMLLVLFEKRPNLNFGSAFYPALFRAFQCRLAGRAIPSDRVAESQSARVVFSDLRVDKSMLPKPADIPNAAYECTFLPSRYNLPVSQPPRLV